MFVKQLNSSLLQKAVAAKNRENILSFMGALWSQICADISN